VTVDLGARSAVGFHDPPEQQHARVAIHVEPAQPGVQPGIDRELRADVGARRTFADHRRVAAGAEREAQRIQQDRLACAGFTGQGGEAFAELDLGRVDDDKVLQPQQSQHRLAVSRAE
jgi:hypothetical protein